MTQFGISPEKFQKNKRLHSFFKIITTSADEDDKVHIDYHLVVHLSSISLYIEDLK